MIDEIKAAITRAAREAGIDPKYALAYAERESSFNPAARSSKTIRGLFQMRGDHRANYGVGDSADPYTQTKGWTGFIKDVKREMAGVLGREPTDAEAYLGHHFGGVRAAKMMRMPIGTPVDAVFTPVEMQANPHFARAGTVGALNRSVLADIDRRAKKHDMGEGALTYGAQAPPSSYGEPVGGEPELKLPSDFGEPVLSEASNAPPASVPTELLGRLDQAPPQSGVRRDAPPAAAPSPAPATMERVAQALSPGQPGQMPASIPTDLLNRLTA